ncbi:Hsp20/alpha crystallin family protein [Legionella gresilensis]|uniref:Hsp20/alpha crystallin family protein n=1 Tax=Legionella gresilensis TaxID=91823 RepID=UPI001041AEC5|nr:Hsp20/alpha crystallin family protein [Legionella gresilensis]
MNNLKRDYFPSLYRDINSLWDNFLRGQQQDDSSFVTTSTWAPSVDIKEDKNQFVVIADIPGVNKEDIHISLENNLLTIQGERNFDKTEEKNGYTRVERAQGQFYRRFSLPQTADDAKISAKYKQGVLEIIIPKKEAALEKKIDIQVEE